MYDVQTYYRNIVIETMCFIYIIYKKILFFLFKAIFAKFLLFLWDMTLMFYIIFTRAKETEHYFTY